jgi:uncharacterized cupredoxin-like copper-binding protein
MPFRAQGGRRGGSSRRIFTAARRRARRRLLVAALIPAVALLTWGLAMLVAEDEGTDHPSPQAQTRMPQSGLRSVRVVLEEQTARPSSVSVAPGSTLRLTLTNPGFAEHDFIVDRLDLHVDVPGGDTRTVQLTDVPKGTVESYCARPGHGESTTFIVQ